MNFELELQKIFANRPEESRLQKIRRRAQDRSAKHQEKLAQLMSILVRMCNKRGLIKTAMLVDMAPEIDIAYGAISKLFNSHLRELCDQGKAIQLAPGIYKIK